MVDLDIANFFNEVDHAILMKLVKEVVKDRRVLGLIRGWLTVGVMEEGNVRYATSGTPQGGLCKASHKPPYAKKVIMQSILLKTSHYLWFYLI